MMMVKVMVTRMMVDDDGNFSAMMLTITFFGLLAELSITRKPRIEVS